MLYPTTIEDVPLYSGTLKIMKFWSFLLRDNWRRYLSLISYSILTVCLFMDLFVSSESSGGIVKNAYIAVLFCNTTLRAAMVCLKRFEYEAFLEEIRLLYIDLMNSGDPWVNRKLQETTVTANFIAKLNLIIGTCSALSFLVYPIFATSKVLPFGIYVPGIDKYETPFYQILFLIQILMTPIGFCMYIPLTNLIVAFILFAILMCKVLQHKLRHLQDVDGTQGREVIVWCIQYHWELIKYVNTINKLTTYIYLVEFISSGAMLCAMLFTLVTVDTIGQKLLVFAYILMIFAQSSVLYYHANELYYQSLKVALAAYESNWHEFDVTTQNILKLLILRAQKPCAILVGRVYPMNLQLLQSLLNATYTYFNLLRKVYG